MKPKSMRCISWNIDRGVNDNIDNQIEKLAGREPDIIALQEVTSGVVLPLRKGLKRIGFKHIRWSKLKNRWERGELIASKWPLKELPATDFVIPFPHKVLSVTIESPWGELEFHTVHIPNGSANGWKKVKTLEEIFKLLAHRAPRPRILCGDFNIPVEEKEDGQIITEGQYRRSGEIWTTWTDHTEERERDTGKRWDKGERDVIDGLKEFDLPDVFRVLNGYKDIQDFSYYTDGENDKNNGAGRRFDHIFASQRLNPIECHYIHEWREQRLSDHSAIEATFEPQEVWIQNGEME